MSYFSNVRSISLWEATPSCHAKSCLVLASSGSSLLTANVAAGDSCAPDSQLHGYHIAVLVLLSCTFLAATFNAFHALYRQWSFNRHRNRNWPSVNLFSPPGTPKRTVRTPPHDHVPPHLQLSTHSCRWDRILTSPDRPNSRSPYRTVTPRRPRSSTRPRRPRSRASPSQTSPARPPERCPSPRCTIPPVRRPTPSGPSRFSTAP